MGKDGKKGLGMGLGALFGEEYPAPQPEREETAPDLLPIEMADFIRSSRASAAGAPAAWPGSRKCRCAS